MKLSYSDYYARLLDGDLHKRIRAGVAGGKLYDVMTGERQYSYVTGSFAKNMFMFDQDPNMIMMHLHWFVGEGLISSSDVEASIGEMLKSSTFFLLGMDYIWEYLEHYKSDDWFPEHWLQIDCEQLISNIDTDVKNNFTKDEKLYLTNFNRQHPELSVEF